MGTIHLINSAFLSLKLIVDTLTDVGTTSSPGVPFVMRWKNRNPWPIGFQDQFLLAVETKT